MQTKWHVTFKHPHLGQTRLRPLSYPVQRPIVESSVNIADLARAVFPIYHSTECAASRSGRMNEDYSAIEKGQGCLIGRRGRHRAAPVSAVSAPGTCGGSSAD